MGEGKRKERENPKQAPHCLSQMWGSNPQNCEIMNLSQNLELDAQPIEPPRHSSANFSLINLFYFERERERAHVHKWGRGRERESQAGSTLSAQSLMQGLNSWIVRS